MNPSRITAAVGAAALCLHASAARAQNQPEVRASGYVQSFYQYNFNAPSNGITNWRAFDNQHDSITIDNVVLETSWSAGRVSGRIGLQVGRAAEMFGMSELRFGNAGAAVGPSNGDMWKYIQQATVGYRLNVGRGLMLDGGIFLSPIGPESVAAKDNWNWSRSYLFTLLPYYHAGIRASYEFASGLTVGASVVNGWNGITDVNDGKSVIASVSRAGGDVEWSLLYMGGFERPTGSPAGMPWRSLLDAVVTMRVSRRLQLRVHADVGFDGLPGDGGGYWLAGAVYARFQAAPWLYLALRADLFHESIGTSVDGSNGGAAPAIFTGAGWVASQTATLDVRPHDNISLRLEYRHDESDAALFFRGAVSGDGMSAPWVTNARGQDTLTLGATAWF
jgi:hypothetical protein